MKNSFFYFILIVVFAGCNSSINNDLSPLDKSSLLVSGMTKPDRHYSKCHPNRCKWPAHDCFPDIIVNPSNLSFVNELDELIGLGQTSTFFSDSGNYQELFPGLFGKAFSDLRNNITTLRKVIVNDSTTAYRIVLNSDTTIQADYFLDYQWDNDSVECIHN